MQPTLSLITPFIDERNEAITPDNSNAILTAASLHIAPVCAGLPGLHEPVVVKFICPRLPQSAQIAW